jgi:hypothetical protein
MMQLPMVYNSGSLLEAVYEVLPTRNPLLVVSHDYPAPKAGISACKLDIRFHDLRGRLNKAITTTCAISKLLPAKFLVLLPHTPIRTPHKHNLYTRKPISYQHSPLQNSGEALLTQQ